MTSDSVAEMIFSIFDLSLQELNQKWFEANKHLTNEEMLDAGLIDECDLIWVNKLRGE